MNFYVGMKVVCVRKRGFGIANKKPWPKEIVVGSVYTIREIDARAGRLGIRLEEYRVEPRMSRVGMWETPFPAEAFKPIKTTDISIFTKMLAPTPKEKVPA